MASAASSLPFGAVPPLLPEAREAGEWSETVMPPEEHLWIVPSSMTFDY
jgi:hypothetical protein